MKSETWEAFLDGFTWRKRFGKSNVENRPDKAKEDKERGILTELEIEKLRAAADGEREKMLIEASTLHRMPGE